MYFDYSFLICFSLSLFVAFLVYALFVNIADSDVGDISSLSVGAVTFLVCFILLFNFSFFSRESMEKVNIAGKKEEQREIRIKELKEKSQIWVNSYDDKKFSTYELYLLKNVQKETKVKVYDKGISLQDKGTKSDSKDFTSLLLKAKTELDKK